MLSDNCKSIIKKELDAIGINYELLNSGVVQFTENIGKEQEEKLKLILREGGYEFKKDEKAQLIESIKSYLIIYIDSEGEMSNFKLSHYLSEQLGYHYTYLANIFSKVEGITIKQYIILEKIERIKIMLVSKQKSLNEIALSMKYKRVSHLSNQFKKITGISPSAYKKTV